MDKIRVQGKPHLLQNLWRKWTKQWDLQKKGRETKENSKLTQKRDDANSNKKNAMTKPDFNTVNEIQICYRLKIMIGEDSIGWRNLPGILESSDEGDTCNSDDEWLSEDFYKQEHMISNIEYTKLKLSNFAVKILNN